MYDSASARGTNILNQKLCQTQTHIGEGGREGDGERQRGREGERQKGREGERERGRVAERERGR
jgi:hypothetical protein